MPTGLSFFSELLAIASFLEEVGQLLSIRVPTAEAARLQQIAQGHIDRPG